MKFAHAWPWSRWFGQRLAETIDLALPQTNISADRDGYKHERTAVCPVPMHWARRLRRRYNQSYLIAAAIAKTRRWPLVQLLYRTRYTPPQTTLPIAQRPANVRRSFGIKPIDLNGWRIVLVDDVMTTGSTLAACARLLRHAGAKHIAVAVAAVADPRETEPATR